MSVNVDTFTSDGVTLAFTLSVTPVNINLITVNIDGVFQQKTSFTLTNNVLTLTGAPFVGAIIEVRTMVAAPASVITGLVLDTFTGDGSTVNFTLSQAPTSKNFTLVTTGGVVQQKSTYSLLGTTITFSTAPANTAPIEVMTFGPAINTSLAAGSNSQVQINNNGALGASTNLTFNTSTNTLNATNITQNSVPVATNGKAIALGMVFGG